MKLTADGFVQTNLVDGTTLTGLFNEDGSLNIVLVDGTSVTGLYHACGAYNVVQVDGLTPCGAYAPCGALNVIVGISGTTGRGPRHASGAFLISSALSNAFALLSGEDEGLAFDFTDQSAYIKDTGTPANDFNSTGIVSSGSLVGPSGKLVYTSPSNKLTLQSDGYYKYQAHNLVPVSATYTSWTKQFAGDSVALSGNADPRGTATHVLTCNGASGVHALYYNNTVAHVAGATYTNSVVVKKGTLRYIQIAEYITVNGNAWANFDLDTGLPTGTQGSQTTPSVTDLGGGYFLCAISYPAGVGTTGGGYIIGITSPTATRAPTTTAAGTYEVGGFHIRRTPSNDDYIETAGAAKYALPIEYDTSGNCLGLLVEEARTNSFANNAIPSTYVTAENVTLTDNYATSPQGITNAHRAVMTAGSVTHRFYKLAILPGATSYTLSCYVKAIDASGYYIGIREDSSTGAGAVFDPANGFAVVGTYTTGAVSAVAASVESVGDGWYRIIASFTSTSMTVGMGLTFVNPAWTSGSFYTSWTPGTTKEIHYWAPQSESGSFPTSPILTYGASASRLADNISIATSAFPHSDSTQSVFVQVITQNATTQGAGVPFFEFHDGTTSNWYRLDRYTSGAACRVTTGGSNQTNAIINGFGTNALIQAGGNPFKGAMSIATNDVSYVGNGGTVTTDTTASLPTVTSLKLGAGVVQPPFCGTIQRISVVPRTKSDAELQTETS